MLEMNGNLTKGKFLLLLELYMVLISVIWNGGIGFLISWAITSYSNHLYTVSTLVSRRQHIRPGMIIILIF